MYQNHPQIGLNFNVKLTSTTPDSIDCGRLHDGDIMWSFLSNLFTFFSLCLQLSLSLTPVWFDRTLCNGNVIYVLRCKILLNSQFHDEHVFLFLFISSPRLIFAEFYKAISEVLFPSHISQCVCSRVLEESNKTDDKKLDERERETWEISVEGNW